MGVPAADSLYGSDSVKDGDLAINVCVIQTQNVLKLLWGEQSLEEKKLADVKDVFTCQYALKSIRI